MSRAVKSPSAGRRASRKSSRRVAICLFLGCFGAYMLNGVPLIGSDDFQANMLFSLNLLKHQSLSITPPQAPEEFDWRLEQPDGGMKQVRIKAWSDEWDALYRNGELRARNLYYMAPSTHPGRYVSTFGIGAPLVLLPVYAVVGLFTDLAFNRAAYFYAAKTAAALLVAGAVALIFLSMRRFAVAPLPAALGALAFGLGTGAWAISSQSPWQQTAQLFFFALGTWCLFGADQKTTRRPVWALYCGAALGMATLCRPTGAIAVVCVGLYLLWLAPPRLLARLLHSPAAAAPGEGRAGGLRRFPALPPVFAYVLGGLPFAALLGAYNAYYFGNPFIFGQELAAPMVMQKTGANGMWSTPLTAGLAGLLFSPSRGLLVYSPVLAFGFIGAAMAWRDPRRYAALIALQPIILADLVVAAKWFDWWGGWSYGPRPLIQTGVFLTLLMIPVIARVARTRWMGGAFAALLLYSVSVQALGAWSYQAGLWDNKNQMNIEKPEYRHRLWSWSDTQIGFYLTHLQKAKRSKERFYDYYVKNEAPIIAAPYESAKLAPPANERNQL